MVDQENQKETSMRLRHTVLLSLLCSCGTIIAPGPFPVRVTSSPSSARVRYEGRTVGTTPCTVQMFGRNNQIEVSADGYQTNYYDVGTSPNFLGAIGNGLLLFPPGLIVDFATGCYRVISDDSVHVVLGFQGKRSL